LDWKELGRLIAAGGSAGKVFWNEPKCMADFVTYFVNYVQRNSCGKCVPCRIGTKRIEDLLGKFLNGGLSEEEEALLRILAEDIGYTSRCDLGRLAGKAVKYALLYCREDFEAHKNGKCNQNIAPHPGWEKVVPAAV